MAQDNAGFDHLDAPGRLTAALTQRPRLVVNLIVAAAILLSWAALLMLAAGAAQVAIPADAGPGGSLLRALPELPQWEWAERLALLCVSPNTANPAPGALPTMWAMWSLMAVAMMLPSAAPMIRTYCEIADTAAAKGEAAVHPLMLVAGYLTVWALASLLFAGLTFGLATAAPLSGYAASAALAVAGLYQFSGLKEACLEKCRNPFAVLFARWSKRPSRIFRLGVEQGLWCLGCCWALMLVMFAVGVMNVFWMALIGLFAIVEKQWESRVPARLAGALLLVWAALLTVVSP
jgi:predicted metal-binding membrane protein